MGSAMVPFEILFVSSYRTSIVTFHLSLRFSEILPLLCSSTPLFPTPPIAGGEKWGARAPIVCPKFSHVPLVVP